MLKGFRVTLCSAALLVVFITVGWTGPLWVSNDLACYEIEKTSSGPMLRYYILNENLTDPRSVMVLFHGYLPDGDPYRQDPLYIANRWGLIELCRRKKVVLLMPVTATELFQTPGEAGKENSETLTMINGLVNRWLGLPIKPELILMGLSSGVENALKYASLGMKAALLIGISGTYDLSILPEDSGEYRLHTRAFGADKAVWNRENPMRVLSESVQIDKFVVLSEEKSIYRAQAESLLSKKPGKSIYVSFLDAGLGHSHNWSYWGSTKVKAAITGLLSEK